jgi:hypothetical protein
MPVKTTMMTRALTLILLPLMAACSPSSGPKARNALRPLVGPSSKADGTAPQIVPYVNNEVQPTFDGTTWYTYDGTTQITPLDADASLAFTADIVTFDAPCGDDPTCLFKVDAVGKWAGAVRLALFSRPQGGSLADWTPLRAADVMTPPVEAKCSPTTVQQRVQVLDKSTIVHLVDPTGADCGWLNTGADPIASDAQLGVMVYPTSGTDPYAYHLAINRATPPGAPIAH